MCLCLPYILLFLVFQGVGGTDDDEVGDLIQHMQTALNKDDTGTYLHLSYHSIYNSYVPSFKQHLNIMRSTYELLTSDFVELEMTLP